MIRAVVLDIGGVLEANDDALFPAPFLARHGFAPEAWERVQPRRDPQTGELTEEELYAAWREGLGLDDGQLAELLGDYWRWYVGVLDPVVLDWFAGLRPGLRTGILSNSGPGAREHERRWGFEGVCDVLVYSHEVGLAKPDPRVYALTTELLAVRPAEVVFVDDVPANVEAARDFGWQAVLHRDAASTVAAVGAVLGLGRR